MSTLLERKAKLIETLNRFEDKDERLKYIIGQGRQLEPMDDKFKMDQFVVKGCISRAWIFPRFQNGKVSFLAHSDAMIVKGIIALLLDIYNDSTPDEILGEDASFLGEVGVTQHLSTNRRNGLSNVLKMIQVYAAAFKNQNSRD